MKKVQFIELSAYENLAPLVSGYLQVYACTSEAVAKSYEFEQYSKALNTSFDLLRDDFNNMQAEVFALSCYIWNIKLFQKLLPILRKNNPDALYILGGPQVMHHANKYLDNKDENSYVCNGEGEVTFKEFLQESLNPNADFSVVKRFEFLSISKTNYNGCSRANKKYGRNSFSLFIEYF